MKFEIVVLKSPKAEVARIKGERSIKYGELTAEEMEQLIHTEAFLEKLTGFRYHINPV